MFPKFNFRHPGSLVFSSLLIVILSSGQGFMGSSLAQKPYWNDNLVMPYARVGHTSCELNGIIYIIGGALEDPGDALGTVLAYDPAENTWSEKASMNQMRFYPASCVYNGKILAVGGAGSGALTNRVGLTSVEEYDPAQDTWTEIANVPIGRWALTATVINGKLFVIGGADKNYQAIGRVDIYDLGNKSWSTGTPMPSPRSGLIAAAIGDQIYTIGGMMGTIYNERGEKTVEVYDPTTDTWFTKQDLQTPRKYFSGCTMNNRLYVFGGATRYCGPILSAAEEYDPESDTWSDINPMPQINCMQTSVPYKGKIYQFGGFVDGVVCPGAAVASMYSFMPIPDDLSLIENFRADKNYLRTGGDSIVMNVKARDSNIENVLVEIETPDRIPVDSVMLFDDGLHHDGIAGDSIFGNIWTQSIPNERSYLMDLLFTKVDSDTITYHLNNLNWFTTIGPVTLDHFTWESLDTTPHPGDNLKIKLYLRNNGASETASNVKVALSCQDTNVIVSSYERAFGTIAAGEAKTHASTYSVGIPAMAYSGTGIKIALDIKSEDMKYWSDTLILEVSDWGTGNLEQCNDGLRISTGPGYGTVNIQIGNPTNAYLEIYSINGALVLQRTTHSSNEMFDMSSFPSGIYILKLVSPDLVRSGKIILK